MTRLPPELPDQDGDDFPERLRTALLAAASSVYPDPAGWRLLNARIRRRRAALRGGGLALAGVAAVLVAVTVLPGGSDPRVEFAPADPAAVADSTATAPPLPGLPTADPSDPAAPSATTPPVVTTPPGVTSPPDAAGILYSDGSSVHVADLDGRTLSTPAALGVSTQTITDVVVRPGGTTETFTMAYRVDGRPDASAAECGDIAWVHVPGGDAPDSSGAIPRTTTAEDCLGAPVFASDGSALGWLATTGDGEVQLQAVDWAEEGPVEGSLTTFGLDATFDAAGVTDPVLVDWTLEVEESSGAGSVGTLVLRASGADGELSTFLRPAERRADGDLILPPVDPGITELVDETGIGGPIIDAHRRWRLVRLATEDAEARIGIATPPLEVDGQNLAPLTGETELLLDRDARPFLDALGDTAVFGVGRAMVLVQADVGDAEAPGSLVVDGELPPGTSAALLAAP